MIFNTRTAEETQALGLRLGRKLRGLDVVCLYGELGSGKTTLTKGIVRGAGCKGRVMSPTFGLARLYRGKKLDLNHLDLYRVGDRDTGDIGIEDFLHDPKAATIVEWPEAAAAYYPKDRLEVRLTHRDAGRKLVFKALGRRARALLSALGEA